MIALKPNPGQQEFALMQPYTIDEILYGGARGGGKTFAGIIWLSEYVYHPRFQGLVIRRNSEDLSDWIERARYMLSGLGVVITGNPAVLRFPSGAIIRTGHLKDDSTYTKYQGHEYQKMLLEELTQIPTKERYMKLISSCRTTIKELKPQIFATANPGGAGHLWVKERFIDPAPANTSFVGEDGTKRVYIPATIDDNPQLMEADPDYVKKIDALKYTDEALYRAWRFGDWNIFVGQVFKEWRPRKTQPDGSYIEWHVISKLPLPLGICKRYISLDWGYNDNTGIHWTAQAPENEVGIRRMFTYREVYDKEKHPTYYANLIADIVVNEPVEYLVLPHDCFSHLGGQNTIAGQFEEVFRARNVDIQIAPAEAKSHAAKIQRQALTHEALSTAPDGLPYWQVMDTCRNLVRTLPALPYDEHKPEEIDEHSEDHAYDSVTYGMYRITNGESIIVQPKGIDRTPHTYLATSPNTYEGGYSFNVEKIVKRNERIRR